MPDMWWIAVPVVAALIGAFFYWRHRRRSQIRLVAFVALLREPMNMDPAVLAGVAGKAWNADLGDGATEGADGFVVGVGITNTIMHAGRMYLVNCFPSPYVEKVEEAASEIADMRIRELFLQHQAWFSCDAMGVDGYTSEDEVRDWYQQLGKLLADLLDDNCLLIFVPDSGLAYPINEDTKMALRLRDPLKALQDTMTVPIIQVPDDDPLMLEAVAKAREGWPTFVKAFEANAGENFSVKAPVTEAGNTEFIWIAVTAIEGELIYGELGNEPGNLGALRLGSKVAVKAAELNDWCFLDAKGNMMGGFTIAVIQKAAQRKNK